MFLAGGGDTRMIGSYSQAKMAVALGKKPLMERMLFPPKRTETIIA